MTGLLVARVDNVIRGTDGVLHRVHRGRTLAHPMHPVVLAAPAAFMPKEVQLDMPGEPDGDVVMSQVTAETAELREDLDAAVSALVAIRDLLQSRDLLPDEREMRQDGWLLRRLEQILAPAPVDSEPVAPPQPQGASKPRKSARPAVGNAPR